METMKFYTEEEILDRHIGEKTLPREISLKRTCIRF